MLKPAVFYMEQTLPGKKAIYKILVVDDSPTVQKVLSRLLCAAHYEPLICATSAEGLASAVRERPDLVLLDVSLPDGNDIDLCAKLKLMQETRHIPVMIMSGYAMQVESMVLGMESGAEDYILKPFMPEDLLARMATILKRIFNT